MKKRRIDNSRRNKKLSIKNQFKESLSYLKESSSYIYISIFLFIISAIIGFTNSSRFSFIDALLKEIISKTTNLNPLELIFYIMQNNIQGALRALVGGILLGIMPIFSAISNGVIIGYVMSKSYQIAGASILFRLVPHGIFELPAIFISLGLGIKLGFSIFSNKNKGQEFLRRFYNSANVFLMIVIPLLIIAAIIEGILIAFIG